MKKGQVWVETVIYTLIGLALIGLVLSLVMPKINEFKDKSAIEQSIDVLNSFDSKVNEVVSAPGNVRKLELKMRRGVLYVSGKNETIIYKLGPITTKYSEVNTSIEIGNVGVLTSEIGSDYEVRLLLNFSEYDLSYDGSVDQNEKFSEVSLPYEFLIENMGVNPTIGKPQIDIRVE